MSFADKLPPVRGSAVPPFTDVRGTREWLKLLPLINIPLAQSELHQALDALNTSQVDALESLRIVEQLRESLHLVQDGLRSDYADKPQPLARPAQTSWEQSLALWGDMEKGYARCWHAATEGHAIAEYLPLLAERTLYYGRQQVCNYMLSYQTVPAVLWQRLFNYYELATSLKIADQKAKDSLIDQAGSSTPLALFVHSLLLASVRTNRMTSRQILWMDRRLELFALRTGLLENSPTQPGKQPLYILLSQPGPAMRSAETPTGADVLHIDTHTLGQSLAKRIKLLREGEQPQNLGLGSELGTQAAESLLAQAYQNWREASTPVPHAPSKKNPTREVALGFKNQHNDVASDIYRPHPDEENKIEHRDIREIQMFGQAVNKQKSSAPPAKIEKWQVLHESAQGLLLLRPADSAETVRLQDMLLVREGRQKLLGVVRALTATAAGVEVLLHFLPGGPFAASIRARDAGRFGQSEFAPAFIMPPVPALKAPVSLIMPHGWYRAARMLELWDGQHLVKIKIESLIERATDHDQAQFVVVK